MFAVNFCLLSALLVLAEANFTIDFNDFLKSTYGAELQHALERKDLNSSGSFGGRTHAGDKLSKQAVVFVHGITMNAFDLEKTRQQYLKKGYSGAELYGTTWGGGDTSTFLDTDMKCEYIKQVRNLIVAVQKYTGTEVDVISYSMGSPIARKAILGGKCVDTGEDLGKPLTEIVDTFVGIAGANHGATLCFLQFGDTCGTTIGLDCSSKFLADINNQTNKYEGRFVYSIFSTDDDVVGYEACGTIASAIPKQDEGFKRSGNHDEVLPSTVELQCSLVLNHKAV